MDPLAQNVEIAIHRAALESIFAECDRFDDHETGGRLIGTYRPQGRRELSITVSGVIEAGPAASRTATSFFQDGKYQEKVFRRLEEQYPEIEHLGNWHTHHMNGYPTLSHGDRETYHRIVNHKNHNTNFFYALLVTARQSMDEYGTPYAVKHFIVYRDDPLEYEIPPSAVRIVDYPPTLPTMPLGNMDSTSRNPGADAPVPNQRVKDQEFFTEFYPKFKPAYSKTLRALYWRGTLEFIDDSQADVAFLEDLSEGEPFYSLSVSVHPPQAPETLKSYEHRRFNSARQLLHQLKTDIDREIFRHKKGK